MRAESDAKESDLVRSVGRPFRIIGSDGQVLGYGRYTRLVKSKQYGDWLDSKRITKAEFDHEVPDADAFAIKPTGATLP